MKEHLFHVDPRTKLVLFFIIGFSSIRETRPFWHAMMTVFLLVLMLNAGQYVYCVKIAGLYIILELASHLLTHYVSGGALAMLFGICRIIIMFVPVWIVFSLMIRTTRVSEFIAAFDRMHMPDEFTIPFAVMFRYFPAMQEQWGAIRDAQKFRGIGITPGNVLRHPVRTLEYTLVPLLSGSLIIADDLSAASLSRGLGGTAKRTCLDRIHFGTADVVIILIGIFFVWNSGGAL